MTDQPSDRAEPPPGVLGALRDGWHSLGGGDAASCPGCPVCRLGESAPRLDPATAEHLQQAVGHLLSAGRELLAALQPPDHAPDHPADHAEEDASGRGRDATTRPTGHDRFPAGEPPAGSAPRRTRIPVDHPTTPQPSDEEHP